MGKEACLIVIGAKKLAVRQGLPASLVECPKVCDGAGPCVSSQVEVFNARIDRERSLIDAKISGQYFANGDKI